MQKKASRTFQHIWFLPTLFANPEKPKELKSPRARRTIIIRTVFILKNEMVEN
jgi:hypothetical protein